MTGFGRCNHLGGSVDNPWLVFSVGWFADWLAGCSFVKDNKTSFSTADPSVRFLRSGLTNSNCHRWDGRLSLQCPIISLLSRACKHLRVFNSINCAVWGFLINLWLFALHDVNVVLS